MSERVSPYHCPYCGEEDLRPHETDEGSPHGSWECRSCMRAFTVRFLGLLRRTDVARSDVARSEVAQPDVAQSEVAR